MEIYFYDRMLYLHIINDDNEDVFFEKDCLNMEDAKWEFVNLKDEKPETALLLMIGEVSPIEHDQKKHQASTFYCQARGELREYRNSKNAHNPNIQQYHDCKKAMQNLYKEVRLSEKLEFGNLVTAWENAFNERFYPKDNDRTK